MEKASMNQLLRALNGAIVERRYGLSAATFHESKQTPLITDILQIIRDLPETGDQTESSFEDLEAVASYLISCAIFEKATDPCSIYPSFIARFEQLMRFSSDSEKIFSLKCWLLQALQHVKNDPQNPTHVDHLIRDLCNAWDRSTTRHQNSPYILYLLSETLFPIVQRWNGGELQYLNEELMTQTATLVLFQVLSRTLKSLGNDGSWIINPSPEACAFAILALQNLSSLPFLGELTSRVKTAIITSRSHLRQVTKKTTNDVSNGGNSTTIAFDAYLKAALTDQFDDQNGNVRNNPKLDNENYKGLLKFTSFFSKLKCVQKIESWKIYGSIVEGFLFLPMLKSRRIDMFDRNGLKDDGYVEFITSTLTVANNLQPFKVNNEVLFELMVLTLRAYQIDEYVEHVIAKTFSSNTEVKKVICSLSKKNHSLTSLLCSDEDGENLDSMERTSSNPRKPQATGKTSPVGDPEKLSEIRAKLQAFSDSILSHPSVRSANPYDQNLLKTELRDYLLAHITQIEDSERYYRDGTLPYGSYHTWVRTTGQTHVFVTFSLAYLQCLIQADDSNHEVSDERRYLVHEIWMHLAKKVRMENDAPSLKRDRIERNLNSLDFPEFFDGKDDDSVHAKEQIARIISYEKRRCDMALQELESLVGESDRTLEVLKFYYFLTDVCGEVYALRDISAEA